MGDYVYIQNYAKRGILAISSSVFDEIVSIAIENIKGVKIKKQEKFLFFLHKPVHCLSGNRFLAWCKLEFYILGNVVLRIAYA